MATGTERGRGRRRHVTYISNGYRYEERGGRRRGGEETEKQRKRRERERERSL